VPTLDEVIELVDRKVPIVVELKSVGAGKAVAKMINNYLVRGWDTNDFEVISFNHFETAAFHRDCPNIKIGASLAGIPLDYCAFATRMNAQSVMLCVEFLTPEFVKGAHDNGLLVYGYTWESFNSDTKSEIERIQALGIDGWASDAPDKAKSFLK
jgi:glycerophosphoryl diester phosphodiesterase